MSDTAGEELGQEFQGMECLLALSAEADPVLATLWDNEKDAAYNRL